MPEFDMALVERINAAIRSVNIRLGPNALAIMTADGTVPLSQGESWFMALAVADELGDDLGNAAVVQRLLDAKDTEIQRLTKLVAAHERVEQRIIREQEPDDGRKPRARRVQPNTTQET